MKIRGHSRQFAFDPIPFSLLFPLFRPSLSGHSFQIQSLRCLRLRTAFSGTVLCLVILPCILCIPWSIFRLSPLRLSKLCGAHLSQFLPSLRLFAANQVRHPISPSSAPSASLPLCGKTERPHTPPSPQALRHSSFVIPSPLSAIPLWNSGQPPSTTVNHRKPPSTSPRLPFHEKPPFHRPGRAPHPPLPCR